MERSHTIAGTPEVKLAVRVRGLSHEQRFFDEDTSTIRITRDFIVIRLRELVDLDSELHITNIGTQIGGTFRVEWINTRLAKGMRIIGLELLDQEGEMWETDSIASDVKSERAVPSALLECQRCYQTALTDVPEAEPEWLSEGFTIARHCDICKATTGWTYSIEKLPAPEVADATPSPGDSTTGGAAEDGSGSKAAARGEDHRQKGRAPIRMTIKIIRTKYGLDIFDVCETINVSRTGVYFTTEQGYEIGEDIAIVLPYHPDSVAIPVPARVVRQDERKGVYQKRVAIQLNPGPAAP